MTLFWRLEDIPEVQHLTPDELKAIVRRHVKRRTAVDLWFRTMIFGFGIGACAGILLHIAGASDMSMMVVYVIGQCAGTLLHWQVMMRRIRKDIRATMKELLRGDRSPVCLGCGYDLRSLTASKCPECGLPVQEED